MSVDKWLGRTFQSKTYTCLHFAADVWEDLSGRRLHDVLAGFLAVDRTALLQARHVGMVRLPGPVDPCVVIAQRPKHRPKGPAHIGIFIRGRVLHLAPAGVQFVELSVFRIGFDEPKFYQC